MELIELRLVILSPTRAIFNKEERIKRETVFNDLIKDLVSFKDPWYIDGLKLDINVKFNDYRTCKDENLKNERILIGTLIIEAEGELEEHLKTKLENYNHNLEENNQEIFLEFENFFEKDFFISLEKRLMDFILCINLAYPCLFEVRDFDIIYKDTYKVSENINLYGELCSDILNFQNELNIPIVNIIPINKCWEWLSIKTNLFEGMGELPIDRALNAMTYIISSKGYDDIFYSMIGIEAIYSTDRSIDITEQIRRKIDILFGTIPGLRKKISKMYEVRSKLMHGSLKFPSKFYVNDATEEFEEFLFKDYMETSKVALVLLVGTIQKFIINSANQIEYEYKVKLS